MLGPGSGRVGSVMTVRVVSPDSLCRWQVQVSVYCARRIHVHLGCTKCSILLHLINICFLLCICLWQISQIQTCLCVVVEAGFVATSPVFIRSSDSHPAGQHNRIAPKKWGRMSVGLTTTTHVQGYSNWACNGCYYCVVVIYSGVVHLYGH